MRILLLQDEIYLPSYGGATKANRFLLQALANCGHECWALTRALTRSPDGPRNESQLEMELASRNVTCVQGPPQVFSYVFKNVNVEAMNFADNLQSQEYATRRIRSLQPDWVLVADDKRRFMIAAAMQAHADRVVLLLQTIVTLPFGPLSVDECPQQTSLMRQARAIVVISAFMRDYLQTYGGLRSHLVRLPLYGAGPFRKLGRFDRGYITMINPCELKGVSIFLALAKEHSQLPFAAVPTWGADEAVLYQLRQLPNVQILKPTDNIEEVLSQTRVLLVPSLWPETFGYVVPEAMLRGIPVLASNLGGLPEAKLGVDYLLPVNPAARRENVFVSPPQVTTPWSQALVALLTDPQNYERVSRQSHEAAFRFVADAEDHSMASFLHALPSHK